MLRCVFTKLARRATLQANPLISIGKSFKEIEIGLITENRLLSYCFRFFNNFFNYYYYLLQGGNEVQPVEGNPYRCIWKICCWRMAEEVR